MESAFPLFVSGQPRWPCKVHFLAKAQYLRKWNTQKATRDNVGRMGAKERPLEDVIGPNCRVNK